MSDRADERSEVEKLIADAQGGERLPEAEKRGLTLGERLCMHRTERRVLHAMTPQECLLAYRQRPLSDYQLMVWRSAYPRQIPRIDGHPEWIAVTLVDVCEQPEYRARVRRVR